MAIFCERYQLLYIMIGGTGCSSVGRALRDHLDGKFMPEEPIYSISNSGKKYLEQKHNTLQDLLDFGLITSLEISHYYKVANVRNPFDVYATVYARFYGPDIEAGITNPDSWVYVDQSGNQRSSKAVQKSIKHLKRMIYIARNQGFDTWLEEQIGWQSQFKLWIKRNLLRKKSVSYKHSYELLADMDDFIRFEHLEEDLNRILKKVGYDQPIALPNVNPTSGKQPYRQYYSPKSIALIESAFRDELDRFGYSF